MNRGDKVFVTHEEEVPSNDPEVGWETKVRVDEGVITNPNGSSQFTWQQDDMDFDYELVLPNGDRGATRSVDMDSEKVRQLHYDAGGDRDWSTYSLKKVEVEGETVFWKCGSCGAQEHDAILVADEEIEMDVTCETVYLTFNDDSGDPGMAFDHDEFRRSLREMLSAEDVESAYIEREEGTWPNP